MKHLIVLRHAKSNWDVSYDGDINRPITQNGIKRAKATGELIKNKSIQIDFALVSVAVRTKQTFDAFLKGYGQSINYEIKNEIYHSDLKTLLNLVHQLDDNNQTVMIVGHEPTCSFFTEQLLKSVNQEIDFRTATLAKIDFEVNQWVDVNWMNGSLDWIDRAKV